MWLFLSVVRADVDSGWLSSAAPSIEKIADLPANTLPALVNRDCVQLEYITYDQKTGTNCFVHSLQGYMQTDGALIIPNGASEGLSLFDNTSNSHLIPVPGQDYVLSSTSAPVYGSNLHVYDDLSREMKPVYGLFQLRKVITAYTADRSPDYDFKDKNGALMSFNDYGTLAFSSNGTWAVVDSPGAAFMKINLASHDITPFASSLNSADDHRNYQAVTAVSDDGRYVAVANPRFTYFKVYDLSTCSGETNNSYSQPLHCQYKDYWPALSSQISGFRSVYSVRFTNDDNLSVSLIYNWKSSTEFSAETVRLTAPGKEAHGIDYLALGDSYISGQGEFVYKVGTDTSNNTCHLSPLSYPYIIGEGNFDSYASVACSGATTNDIGSTSGYYTGQVHDRVRRKDRDNVDALISNFDPGYLAQLEFIKHYQPRVVTISISGNDIGFSDILKSCVAPHLTGSNTCYNTYYERLQAVNAIDAAYWKLQSTYAAIRQADPGVHIYAIGYPQIAAQGSCGDNVHLNATEIEFSQELIAYLDWAVQQAAVGTGVQYVDTQDALNGHRLCETSGAGMAVNGLTAGNDAGIFGMKFLGSESYHPTVLGHHLLADWILGRTHKLTSGAPAPGEANMPDPSDPLAQALLYDEPVPPDMEAPQVETADGSIAPTTVAKTAGTMSVTVDGNLNGLQANALYTINLRSGDSVIALGTFASDASGALAAQPTLPTDVPAGFQTLHVSGENMAGQTVDIYKIIYIAANEEDYDGDGIPNSEDQCVIVPLSGKDTDDDGIDDACDPVIGSTEQVYPQRVKLTGNAIEGGGL